MSFLRSTLSWLMLATGWSGGDVPGDPFAMADESAPPLAIVSAVSRRIHPATTPVVGDIDLLGPDNIEPRLGGPTQLVVGFDGDVHATSGGEVTCANVMLSSGMCLSVTGSGTPTLTIAMHGTPRNQCVQVSLMNIPGLPHTDEPDFTVRPILGDVNLDGVVNLIDLHLVKKHWFQGGPNPLVEFLSDVNVDGVINIVDLGDLPANMFGYLWECP